MSCLSAVDSGHLKARIKSRRQTVKEELCHSDDLLEENLHSDILYLSADLLPGDPASLHEAGGISSPFADR